MTIDKILVSIFGALGIIFTAWYFFGKNEKVYEAEGSIDILVEGGYRPDIISIPFRKTTKINFLRKDKNSCLEELILPEFKIKKFLPMNQKVSIELTPDKKGRFDFSCGMGMFHGKLIVK